MQVRVCAPMRVYACRVRAETSVHAHLVVYVRCECTLANICACAQRCEHIHVACVQGTIKSVHTHLCAHVRVFHTHTSKRA